MTKTILLFWLAFAALVGVSPAVAFEDQRPAIRAAALEAGESRKRICKLAGPQTRKPCNLKSTKPPKNDSRSVG